MRTAKPIRINLDMTPLVDRLTDAMVSADVLGRIRVLLEASAKGAQVNPMGKLNAETFDELLGSFDVKPEGAIEYIQALTSYSKAAAARLRGQYRLAAFTIARVEQIALLDKTKDLLAQSLDQGWTREQFIVEMNRAFDAAGVTRLNPYHADLVFNQNLATAYANGRYQQMSDPDVALALPFWRYRTMEDELVRPNHAALDLFVAKQGDPVWGTIYPPNGFNCRCRVEPLLAREGREALGANVDVPGSSRLPPGGRPDPGFSDKPGKALRTLASGEAL